MSRGGANRCMLEAERQFRRIIGYRDLANLALAIERDLAHMTVPSPTEEAGAAQRRAPVVPCAPANAGGCESPRPRWSPLESPGRRSPQ
jgi:hypothetical protein